MVSEGPRGPLSLPGYRWGTSVGQSGQCMTSRLNRGPKPDRRRALELLAGSPDGMTEALLVAHGFTVKLLVALIRDGLASAKSERVVAGGKPMEVTRVRITETGRRALAATK
jgi:hypothetical protein